MQAPFYFVLSSNYLSCISLSENPANVSTTDQLVEVVFTGNTTADSYIEREVFAEVERGARQVWAATNDRAQAMVSSSKGAHVWSASLFIQELKKAKREGSRLCDQSDTGKGEEARAQMLISNVTEETVSKLYKLRKALDKG